MYYAGIGSRQTPAEILAQMTKCADYMSNLILRTRGADTAFQQGRKNTELWLPWIGFNGHWAGNLPSEQAFIIAEELHPNWKACSEGARKLHARNIHQILGADLKTPSKFVLCWTPDGSRGITTSKTGGTGQALRLAYKHNIPIVNMYNNTWKAEMREVYNQL